MSWADHTHGARRPESRRTQVDRDAGDAPTAKVLERIKEVHVDGLVSWSRETGAIARADLVLAPFRLTPVSHVAPAPARRSC
jgi:hypothetical protein